MQELRKFVVRIGVVGTFDHGKEEADTDLEFHVLAQDADDAIKAARDNCEVVGVAKGYDPWRDGDWLGEDEGGPADG
jgi:hypothetical protein